jgi:hypothetical protein
MFAGVITISFNYAWGKIPAIPVDAAVITIV